jgi:hypothetical protein
MDLVISHYAKIRVLELTVQSISLCNEFGFISCLQLDNCKYRQNCGFLMLHEKFLNILFRPLQ